MKLIMEEIGFFFLILKFGMKKKIFLVWDELKEKEDVGDLVYDNSCLNFEERVDELLLEKFIEIFRGFNCVVRDFDYYRFNLVLICDKINFLSFL